MKKEFEINEKIYPKTIIKQTIIAFEDVSEIIYNKGKLEISGDTINEIEEIFNEFMNYVIGLINE